MFLLETNFIISVKAFNTVSVFINFLKVFTCFLNPIIYSGFTFDLYKSQIVPFFQKRFCCKSREEERNKPYGFSQNLEIPSTSLVQRLRRYSRSFFQSVSQNSQYNKTNLLLSSSVSMIIFLLLMLAVLTLKPFLPLQQQSWPEGTALVVLGGMADVEIISPDEERIRNCSIPPLPLHYNWNSANSSGSAFIDGHLIYCFLSYCLSWRLKESVWTSFTTDLIGSHTSVVKTSAGVWIIDTKGKTTQLLTGFKNNSEPVLSEGPTTKTWLEGACVTWAYGDSVVIIGGADDNYVPLPTVELYDGNMNFYKTLPNLSLIHI